MALWAGSSKSLLYCHILTSSKSEIIVNTLLSNAGKYPALSRTLTYDLNVRVAPILSVPCLSGTIIFTLYLVISFNATLSVT